MKSLPEHWSRLSAVALLLYPLSLLFGLLSAIRRLGFRLKMLHSGKVKLPVIIIGNITVGGTGKTPFTLALVEQLLARGYHPAIITRGYGGNMQGVQQIMPDCDSQLCGDEPALMARRQLCPVVVGRDRLAAAQYVVAQLPECDLILSDDGLQHYRLQRDVELVLIDGERRLGNGLLLPAGPLREPASRLNHVDAVIINGGQVQPGQFGMQLHGEWFYQLQQPQRRVQAEFFLGKRVHAVAGIGNPARFFRHLQQLGIDVESHPFADHHAFQAGDLQFDLCDAVLMTEKDAVKCASFADENCWVLRVDASIPSALLELILKKAR